MMSYWPITHGKGWGLHQVRGQSLERPSPNLPHPARNGRPPCGAGRGPHPRDGSLCAFGPLAYVEYRIAKYGNRERMDYRGSEGLQWIQEEG